MMFGYGGVRGLGPFKVSAKPHLTEPAAALRVTKIASRRVDGHLSPIAVSNPATALLYLFHQFQSIDIQQTQTQTQYKHENYYIPYRLPMNK